MINSSFNSEANRTFDPANYQSNYQMNRNNNNTFCEQRSIHYNSTMSKNNKRMNKTFQIIKYPSCKPSSSLAEENLVRNFNQFSKNNEKQNLPINLPQRIELPLFFNTPCRNVNPRQQRLRGQSSYQGRTSNMGNYSTNDSFNGINNNNSINKSFYMAKTFINPNNSQILNNSLLNVSDIAIKQDQPQQQHNSNILQSKVTETSVYLQSLKRLKDYAILAFACQRAGKTRDEGRAYYSMGVLNDNIGRFKQAVGNYKKFLNVCRSIGDVHGEALAYNCIGVDFQLLGEDNSKYYNESIEYHKKHELIADVNGKFLACINLGLCYNCIQDNKNSLFYYQQALKYSIKMNNIVGQSIAIGNIGKIGTKGLHDNKEKMKLLIEKYLKLSVDLRDRKGEMNAQMKLGQLTAQNGEFSIGKECFQKALELAECENERGALSIAKCGYAVANAETNMNAFLNTYASKIKQQEQ